MRNSRRKPYSNAFNTEQAITKAREYLETGEHANWSAFRPLFHTKFRNGKELPPHKDWVRNFFLPSVERRLIYQEKLLQRLS